LAVSAAETSDPFPLPQYRTQLMAEQSAESLSLSLKPFERQLTVLLTLKNRVPFSTNTTEMARAISAIAAAYPGLTSPDIDGGDKLAGTSTEGSLILTETRADRDGHFSRLLEVERDSFNCAASVPLEAREQVLTLSRLVDLAERHNAIDAVLFRVAVLAIHVEPVETPGDTGADAFWITEQLMALLDNSPGLSLTALETEASLRHQSDPALGYKVQLRSRTKTSGRLQGIMLYTTLSLTPGLYTTCSSIMARLFVAH
jgi:hypothetical protein